MSTGADSELNGSQAAASTQQYVGKLGYALGISIAILLLITIVTLLYYFCVRAAAADALHPRHSRQQEDDDISIRSGLNDAGLDDAALKSCPKVTYAEAKHRDPLRVPDSCCSICLADYGDDDEVLRLLPECGHLFHEKCVDPWLRRRPTCPVCRSSPAPSPTSTPLAEVVPLASRLV